MKAKDKIIKENLLTIYVRNQNLWDRSTHHILDEVANLNRHIHSDEGLQYETTVPILFTTV